jgi:hypothetical protein
MLQKFLYACAGAHIPLVLKDEYAFERSRYSGIGAAVLLVSVMAVGSFSYAVNLAIRQPLLSVIAGLIFGTMIFNLDRMLVISLRKPKDGYKARQLLLIGLRLFVAGLLGFVVTTPLVLRFFEPEIDAHHARRVADAAVVNEERAVAAFPRIQELRAVNDSLARVERETHEEVMSIEQRAKNEGNGVYGIPGPGWRYRQDMATLRTLQTKADEQRREHDSIRDKNAAELAVLMRKQGVFRDSLWTAEAGSDGVGARLQAMHELQREKPAILWAHWLLVLALMTLELSPILVKLAMSRGAVDAELDRLEMAAISKSEAGMDTAKESARTWAGVDQLALGEDAVKETDFRRKLREENHKVRVEASIELVAAKRRAYLEVMNHAMASPELTRAKVALMEQFAMGMIDELREMMGDMFTHRDRADTAAEAIKRTVMADAEDEIKNAGEIFVATDDLRRRASGDEVDQEDEGDSTLQFGT